MVVSKEGWSFVVADRGEQTCTMLNLVRPPNTDRPLTEEDVSRAQDGINSAMTKLRAPKWKHFRTESMSHQEAVAAGLLPGVDVVRIP